MIEKTQQRRFLDRLGSNWKIQGTLYLKKSTWFVFSYWTIVAWRDDQILNTRDEDISLELEEANCPYKIILV